MPRAWPFDEPPDLGVLSLRQVFEDDRPILLVSHDEEGDWQFLDGSDAPRVEDGVIVCLAQILERDPTVAELSDLPMGWIAWRSAIAQSWTREPNPWRDEGSAEV
jgi:hypothetical protein